MTEAVRIVSAGRHDPWRAHSRIREFYNWKQVAERTEKVYANATREKSHDLYTRIMRHVYHSCRLAISTANGLKNLRSRSLCWVDLSRHAGRRYLVFQSDRMAYST